jgi:hypothetical protein
MANIAKAQVQWARMIGACTDPTHRSYGRHGASGIKIHPAWAHPLTGFAAFVLDMGIPPKGAILARNDRRQDFTPANCHWRDVPRPSGIGAKSIYVTYGGTTLPLVEWCRLLHLDYETARARKRRGFTDEETLFSAHGQKRQNAAVSPGVIRRRLEDGWEPEDAVQTPYNGQRGTPA